MSVHALLLFSLARCPTLGRPGGRLSAEGPTTRSSAPARLAFVTLRPSSAGVPARRPSRGTPSTVVPTPDMEGVLPSIATGGAADTGRMSAGEEPRRILADSGPAPVVEYERPLHPALRGLVPTYSGSAIWRGMVSGAMQPPPLAPRPASCAPNASGYFSCSRRLLQWREDSIYHVVFRCARDTLHLARAIPPDCAAFLAETIRVRGLLRDPALTPR